jgi:hypothetical protein
MTNTPFHLLVKLIKVYRLCEGDAFCDATAITAKCAIAELVWKYLGAQLSYNVLFDFARTTPTRLLFDVLGNTKGMGKGNAPPPVSYQIIVTDGLLALSGTRTTSPPHNTDHIVDVFQNLFVEMK